MVQIKAVHNNLSVEPQCPGPYQSRDLSNCGAGRLCVAINCGVLSVNDNAFKNAKKTASHFHMVKNLDVNICEKKWPSTPA